MENDAWIKEREEITQKKVDRWNNDINVLVSAYSGQLIFLKACLESVRSIGWILLMYDNPSRRFDTHMPTPEMFKLVDQFFMKEPTSEIPGPAYPQFWQFRHGCDILLGSEAPYIFVIGGDSVLEKPEGIVEIVKMLEQEKGDIISCSTRNKIHGKPFVGSKSFLVKKLAFFKMVNFLEKGFVPLDHQYGSFENRMGLAVQETGVKEVKTPENPSHDQFAYDYDSEGNCVNRGTWGKILGYRHLAGEHKIRKIKKQKPIEQKYFDTKYLRKQDLETMVKYWETGDFKYIEKWWET